MQKIGTVILAFFAAIALFVQFAKAQPIEKEGERIVILRDIAIDSDCNGSLANETAANARYSDHKDVKPGEIQFAIRVSD